MANYEEAIPDHRRFSLDHTCQRPITNCDQSDLGIRLWAEWLPVDAVPWRSLSLPLVIPFLPFARPIFGVIGQPARANLPRYLVNYSAVLVQSQDKLDHFGQKLVAKFDIGEPKYLKLGGIGLQ